jgi:chromosome segregation ATPase
VTDNELKQYFDNLNERIESLNERIDNLSERTTAEFRQMRGETAAEFQRIATEFKQVRAENAAAHVETRRHFDSTIDRLQSKFDLLGDGLKNIDEKLDREAADIRAEMRQGFADTHALIRFSHAQRN